MATETPISSEISLVSIIFIVLNSFAYVVVRLRTVTVTQLRTELQDICALLM